MIQKFFLASLRSLGFKGVSLVARPFIYVILLSLASRFDWLFALFGVAFPRPVLTCDWVPYFCMRAGGSPPYTHHGSSFKNTPQNFYAINHSIRLSQHGRMRSGWARVNGGGVR